MITIVVQLSPRSMPYQGIPQSYSPVHADRSASWHQSRLYLPKINTLSSLSLDEILLNHDREFEASPSDRSSIDSASFSLAGDLVYANRRTFSNLGELESRQDVGRTTSLRRTNTRPAGKASRTSNGDLSLVCISSKVQFPILTSPR